MSSCFLVAGEKVQFDDFNAAGPLNSNFAQVMLQLNDSSTAAIVDPRPLHAALGKRYRVFKGGRQHNSHELLRLLLEGLIDEAQKVTLEYCSTYHITT